MEGQGVRTRNPAIAEAIPVWRLIELLGGLAEGTCVYVTPAGDVGLMDDQERPFGRVLLEEEELDLFVDFDA